MVVMELEAIIGRLADKELFMGIETPPEQNEPGKENEWSFEKRVERKIEDSEFYRVKRELEVVTDVLRAKQREASMPLYHMGKRLEEFERENIPYEGLNQSQKDIEAFEEIRKS